MMVEIIAPIVNFAVVLFIVWKYGRGPFLEFLQTRSKQIETQIREAETLSGEAKRLLDEAEKNWASSQEYTRQFAAEAKGSIARFREQTVSAARSEAERVKGEAERVEQSERARARNALEQELAQRSVALARKYLASHLDEKERHKLISDYVEMVRNGTAG